MLSFRPEKDTKGRPFNLANAVCAISEYPHKVYINYKWATFSPFFPSEIEKFCCLLMGQATRNMEEESSQHR